jgi:hypothetical protein
MATSNLPSSLVVVPRDKFFIYTVANGIGLPSLSVIVPLRLWEKAETEIEDSATARKISFFFRIMKQPLGKSIFIKDNKKTYLIKLLL